MQTIEQLQATALDQIFDICLTTSRKTANLKKIHFLTPVSEAFPTEPQEPQEMLYIKEGTVYQRSDGRYCAELYIFGKQRQVTIRKYKTAAVARLNDVVKLKQEGKINSLDDFQKACRGLLKSNSESDPNTDILFFPQQSGPFLFDWIETWLSTYKEDKVNRSYFIQLRSCLNVHIKPNFQNLPILAYPALELQQGLDKIQLPRMKENARSVLYGAFQKAYELDLIPKNYMALVEYKKHKRKPRNAFSKQDQKIFLDFARQHPMGNIFLFELFSGCRPGEARRVKWEHLNYEHDTIFIDGTKNEYAKRHIPFFQKLHQILDPLPKDSDFIFPYQQREVSAAFDEILRQANLSGYEQYSLRHTFATRANEAGIDVKTIAAWLGHNDIRTTEQVYIAMQDEHQIAMKEKFDRF